MGADNLKKSLKRLVAKEVAKDHKPIVKGYKPFPIEEKPAKPKRN